MNISKRIFYNQRYIAGAIMFFVGAFALMGIITSETLYPGYSTLQEISDLGASRPPNSIIHQPSATIFNTTMIISGALLLTATYFVKKKKNNQRKFTTNTACIFQYRYNWSWSFPRKRNTMAHDLRPTNLYQRRNISSNGIQSCIRTIQIHVFIIWRNITNNISKRNTARGEPPANVNRSWRTRKMSSIHSNTVGKWVRSLPTRNPNHRTEPVTT